MLTDGPPDDMRTSAALGIYGQQVLAALHAWWDPKPDKTGLETVQTYYGPQLLHELMERTTWHCGQHVRQWFMLLGMAGIAPVASRWTTPPLPACRCRAASGTARGSRVPSGRLSRFDRGSATVRSLGSWLKAVV